MITKISHHVHKYRSGYLLATTSVLFIVYSLYIYQNTLSDWSDVGFVTDYVKNISTFIPVALILSGIIIGGFDNMKLFSDAYNEGKKAELKKAVEDALKQDRTKTKNQILKGLKEQGINGENIRVIENIIDQIISVQGEN